MNYQNSITIEPGKHRGRPFVPNLRIALAHRLAFAAHRESRVMTAA